MFKILTGVHEKDLEMLLGYHTMLNQVKKVHNERIQRGEKGCSALARERELIKMKVPFAMTEKILRIKGLRVLSTHKHIHSIHTVQKV